MRNKLKIKQFIYNILKVNRLFWILSDVVIMIGNTIKLRKKMKQNDYNF